MNTHLRELSVALVAAVPALALAAVAAVCVVLAVAVTAAAGVAMTGGRMALSVVEHLRSGHRVRNNDEKGD